MHLNFETVNTPSHINANLFTIRDPNDYPVLYSAVVGQADVVVTGDKDFQDVHVNNVSIMTPVEFVRKFA